MRRSSIMDSSTSSSSSDSSGNSSTSEPPNYESLILVEQTETSEEASLRNAHNAIANGKDCEINFQPLGSNGEPSITVGSDVSIISDIVAASEDSDDEIQVENIINHTALSPPEQIISQSNNLMAIEIYEDDEDEDEDMYDYDDEDDDDFDETTLCILKSSIASVQASSVPRNTDASADAEAETITERMRQLHRENIRNAYAQILSDENSIADDHARMIAAASSRLSVTGSSACSSRSSTTNQFDVPSSIKKVTSPSAKYNRQDFLRTMQDSGSRSPLHVVIDENFELNTDELKDLVDNLSWMFGDIDGIFCMSKLQLEKLDYQCMVKFTAGDYVMQSKGLKCRDREHFLKYSPLEVICCHYLHVMVLLLLKKPANAYQVVADMKASVTYMAYNLYDEDAINSHTQLTVCDFILKNCELFFNFVTGRTAFECDGVIPSVDDWSAQQRLYLSLACYLVCATIDKPMEFDLEAFIEGMLFENIFMAEWGLHILATFTGGPNRKEKEKSLKCLIIDALEKDYSRCKNPFIFLHILDSPYGAIIAEAGEKGLMIKLRNFINSYGTVVRARLDVAAKLALCPFSLERNSLIRSCLERAVELNSLHPEANFRLGLYYSQNASSRAPLCIRYLKASLAVDSSRFEAVMEYCQLLMGKQFRLMSAALTSTSSQKTLELEALDGHNHLCTLDVPSIIIGFTSGVGAKFWTTVQIAELRLLLFYSLMMMGSDKEALEILLSIYQHNKIISNIRNVHVVRDKYEWSSARVTLKHLVSVFTETYLELLQKEDFQKTINKPSSSAMVIRRRAVEGNMKTMLRVLLSSFKDDIP